MEIRSRRRHLRYLNGLTIIALAILFVGISLLGTIETAQAQRLTPDVDGPDDMRSPNRADLSQMGFTQAGTTIDVRWSFDDTSFGQEAQGCALIDSDGDGNVNFSLCQNVNGIPAVSTGFFLYSCSDEKDDTCSEGGGGWSTGEITPGSDSDTTCSISVVSDPFNGVGTHNSVGGIVAHDPVDDTGVECRLDSADLPPDEITAPLTLMNVCSYPSPSSPNSDKDCIVDAGTGFLEIVKVADPDVGTQFDFTLGPASISGDTLFSINGSGSVTGILVTPDFLYSLSESVPDLWELKSATCTTNNVATGTLDKTLPISGPDDAGLTGIVIERGQDTICTFTNYSGSLAVTIGYFLAEQDGDSVRFTWQTATETGTVGFNLLAESDGALVQLNDELIPSKVIDSVVPTDYQYEALSSATVFFIEEIDINGKSDRLGPFILGTPAGVRTGDNPQFTPVIWLPMIRR